MTLNEWKQKANDQGIDASSCSDVPCVKQKMGLNIEEDTITEIPDILDSENKKQATVKRQRR